MVASYIFTDRWPLSSPDEWRCLSSTVLLNFGVAFLLLTYRLVWVTTHCVASLSVQSASPQRRRRPSFPVYITEIKKEGSSIKLSTSGPIKLRRRSEAGSHKQPNKRWQCHRASPAAPYIIIISPTSCRAAVYSGSGREAPNLTLGLSWIYIY